VGETAAHSIAQPSPMSMFSGIATSIFSATELHPPRLACGHGVPHFVFRYDSTEATCAAESADS
jgi:hypothetical protein